MKKRIIRQMVTTFQLLELGYDFMGYTFDNKRELSFHHLIIPKRSCRMLHLGAGQQEWNGAILNRFTSHEYLHLIERLDPALFYAITSELIDENALQRIEIESLKRIRQLLLEFEREHKGERRQDGQYVIKPKYISERISLKSR